MIACCRGHFLSIRDSGRRCSLWKGKCDQQSIRCLEERASTSGLMARYSTATGISLAVRGGPGITLRSPPQGLRGLLIAGAAVASGLWYLLRKAPADATRRRVLNKLDKIAPRVRYNQDMEADGTILNGECEFTTIQRLTAFIEYLCQRLDCFHCSFNNLIL